MYLVIFLFIILGIILAMLYPEHAKRLLRAILVAPLAFISPISEALTSAISGISQFMRKQMYHGERDSNDAQSNNAPEHAREDIGFHLVRFLISGILTFACLVCVAYEYQFNGLTYESMGLMMSQGHEPIWLSSLASISAISLLCIGIVWGIVWLDTTRTTFYLPPSFLNKKPLQFISMTIVIVAIIMAFLMGVWRMRQAAYSNTVAPQSSVNQGELTGGLDSASFSAKPQSQDSSYASIPQPKGFDAELPLLIGGLLAGLVLITGLFTINAAIWFMRYLLLFATGLLVLVLIIILLLYNMADRFLATFIDICNHIVDILANMWRSIMHRKNENANKSASNPRENPYAAEESTGGSGSPVVSRELPVHGNDNADNQSGNGRTSQDQNPVSEENDLDDLNWGFGG